MEKGAAPKKKKEQQVQQTQRTQHTPPNNNNKKKVGKVKPQNVSYGRDVKGKAPQNTNQQKSYTTEDIDNIKKKVLEVITDKIDDKEIVKILDKNKILKTDESYDYDGMLNAFKDGVNDMYQKFSSELDNGIDSLKYYYYLFDNKESDEIYDKFIKISTEIEGNKIGRLINYHIGNNFVKLYEEFKFHTGGAYYVRETKGIVEPLHCLIFIYYFVLKMLKNIDNPFVNFKILPEEDSNLDVKIKGIKFDFGDEKLVIPSKTIPSPSTKNVKINIRPEQIISVGEKKINTIITDDLTQTAINVYNKNALAVAERKKFLSYIFLYQKLWFVDNIVAKLDDRDIRETISENNIFKVYGINLLEYNLQTDKVVETHNNFYGSMAAIKKEKRHHLIDMDYLGYPAFTFIKRTMFYGINDDRINMFKEYEDVSSRRTVQNTLSFLITCFLSSQIYERCLFFKNVAARDYSVANMNFFEKEIRFVVKFCDISKFMKDQKIFFDKKNIKIFIESVNIFFIESINNVAEFYNTLNDKKKNFYHNNVLTYIYNISNFLYNYFNYATYKVEKKNKEFSFPFLLSLGVKDEIYKKYYEEYKQEGKKLSSSDIFYDEDNCIFKVIDDSFMKNEKYFFYYITQKTMQNFACCDIKNLEFVVNKGTEGKKMFFTEVNKIENEQQFDFFSKNIKENAEYVYFLINYRRSEDYSEVNFNITIKNDMYDYREENLVVLFVKKNDVEDFYFYGLIRKDNTANNNIEDDFNGKLKKLDIVFFTQEFYEIYVGLKYKIDYREKIFDFKNVSFPLEKQDVLDLDEIFKSYIVTAKKVNYKYTYNNNLYDHVVNMTENKADKNTNEVFIKKWNIHTNETSFYF